MSKSIICTDFDGVLNSYSTPWQGPGVIPDPPVPGAIEWIQAMQREFTVVICSVRCHQIEGIDAIAAWLTKHGLPQPALQDLELTDIKPPAMVYIDDRAWLFKGSFPTAEDLWQFRPWNKP